MSQLKNLASLVKTLESEIKSLREQVQLNSHSKPIEPSQVHQPQLVTTNSTFEAGEENGAVTHSQVTDTATRLTKNQQKDSSSENRKFNIVMFGVPEQQPGLSRFSRLRNDYDKVSSIVNDVDNCNNCIRDCRRLGKFKRDMSRPRPILISLASTANVRNLLMNRQSLPDSITIKPDLSPNERKIEAILLQERWKLIQSGIGKKSIKLRGSTILVNNRCHGKVINMALSLSPSLGDLAPQLNSVSNPTPTESSETMVQLQSGQTDDSK